MTREHSDTPVAPEVATTRGSGSDDQPPRVKVVTPAALGEESVTCRRKVLLVRVNLLKFFGSSASFQANGVEDSRRANNIIIVRITVTVKKGTIVARSGAVNPRAIGVNVRHRVPGAASTAA